MQSVNNTNQPELFVLQAFSEFSRNYLMARCFSQKYIDQHWWAVRSFVEANGDILTSAINETTHAAWVEHMSKKGNAKTTIHTNVSNFRLFIGYLNLKGLCELTKDQIKAPRRPKTIPKYVDKQKVEAMIQTACSVRDKAIVAVMFSTGLRNSELRALKRSDIQGDTVRVYGKGDKEDTVFLDTKAKGLLDQYWASRTDKSVFAFVSNRGGKIACSTLRYIYAHLSSRAGIDHVSPHQVRHGTGTHLMRGGMHIRSIQEYLRHEYVTTTELYTHIDKIDLKQDFARIMTA